MRTEQEIFNELAALCASRGYAHAIAFFCYRDNIVGYADQLKAEDYSKLFSMDRLIRTEVSTLIGLMARAPIDYALPPQQQLETLIERTEELLKELHQVMLQPFEIALKAAIAKQKSDPFDSAEAMREPIFYGSESAYSFQYRDLAPKKYARDKAWLRQNKGFSIEEAKRVVGGISTFHNDKLLTTLCGMKDLPPEAWSVLEGFTFSPLDLVAICELPIELIKKVLSAFAFAGDGNPTFTSLQVFNATNAYPLLEMPDGRYVLFQYTSLAEALYDTPFYWMGDDKAYEETAMANRGVFTEEFAAERLERVFGQDKVFRNVDIWKSKGTKLGEIDALVLFGNRAIVVQAKSKKLTLAARKGNDLQLKADFKSAVQDACDQAYVCSHQLLSTSAVFTDSAGKQIQIPAPIKAIHPICVVADHYPALSFQSHQFLKYTTTDTIKAPLVCDVFLIDAVTEMLETPLRLLSYLELRAIAGDNVILSHEIVALGFHLKQNLWLGEYDLIQLGDDISADVDVAMAVRREGIPGERTPPGVLTQLRDLSVGRIIQEIEKKSEAAAVELGLQLLKLSGSSARDLSSFIDKIVSQAAKDGKEHDATIGLGKAGTGITVHCNDLPDSIAASKLRAHCEIRKYSQKAATWFGMIVRPGDGVLRLGLKLDYPWAADKQMDAVVDKMPKGLPPDALRSFARGQPISIRPNVGKNQRCPCGSMLKYKKCCLRKRK